MHAANIVGGAPTWVYILLVALVLLGVRRLRTREVPAVVALLPSAAFLIWSIAGANTFAARAGAAPAAVAWLVGAAIGAVSFALLPEPRGERLAGGRVRQPGSRIPLVLYLGVFAIRFACGAWAAVAPAQAFVAIGIGIAVSAAVTTRLLVGVARWRSAHAQTIVA